LNISGQFQDPEWSAHPDYIACLGDELNDQNWDGYIVRISDKKFLKIRENGLIETSTPHLWVTPSATPGIQPVLPVYSAYQEGCADSLSIQTFFGTDSVKFIYSVKASELTLYFVDYSSGVIKPIPLQKPLNRSDWDIESPIFSPDGNWVLYNCINHDIYECYIQQLNANSRPILIAESAADPHWWIHPESHETYIVYVKITGDYFSQDDYTDPLLSDGSLGGTYKQHVRISTGSLPAHAVFEMIDAPVLIAKLPFKGGISADGRYLCTGYGDGFIIRLF
jgi:hypothetical protein